jgi:hypothetical protein
VPALVEALAAAPQLTALNLNDTGLGPEGVTQLAGGLLAAYATAEAAGQPRQRLQELGLALNEVDAAAAKVGRGGRERRWVGCQGRRGARGLGDGRAGCPDVGRRQGGRPADGGWP